MEKLFAISTQLLLILITIHINNPLSTISHYITHNNCMEHEGKDEIYHLKQYEL